MRENGQGPKSADHGNLRVALRIDLFSKGTYGKCKPLHSPKTPWFSRPWFACHDAVCFKLGSKDVFLNITGGIKVDDPAIDLGVVCAILSSNVDMAIDDKSCFAAEVGLSGEIRPVNRCEQRIQEAEKLGFERIFISKYNKVNPQDYNIQVVTLGKMEEVFRALFAS